MSEQRPESFSVSYKDREICFTKFERGYYYKCPCGAKGMHWLDTESGTMHTLKFDDTGRATIRNSIGSKHCALHIMVTDGVATDC